MGKYKKLRCQAEATEDSIILEAQSCSFMAAWIFIHENGSRTIYIDASLAAMNFMMALETMGLSSCPINWPDIEEREQLIAKEFNLQPSEKGIMFISIGYPLNKGGIPFSAKKSVEQVTTIL